MSAEIHRPQPRFVVETADTIIAYGGARSQGMWRFAFAFDLESDAITQANRLAEDNEFVRVIDRTATNEEKN